MIAENLYWYGFAPDRIKKDYEFEFGIWLNISKFECKEKLNMMEAVQFSSMDQIVPREWFEFTSETTRESDLLNAEVNMPRHLYRHRLKKGE